MNQPFLDITAALAASTDPAQVSRALVDDTAKAFGLTRAELWLASDDGAPPALARATGAAAPAHASMSMPLTIIDRSLGSLVYGFDRAIDGDDRARLVLIARFGALALDRIRLLDQERDARAAVHVNELFAGVVGHDLRNPLSAIVASTELALMRAKVAGVDAAVLEPLHRILTSGDRMARMIDQLLDFTRVRAGGGMPCDPAPTDLAKVCREIVGELRSAAPDIQIAVIETGTSTGTWDADRLSQMLSNLISNGIEHGRPGAPISVTIDGTAAAAVRVAIANLGTIPAELVPFIFEPFRQALLGGEHTRGLGLGLYISQQIVLAHGGTIDVASSDADGTTFTITLPRNDENPR